MQTFQQYIRDELTGKSCSAMMKHLEEKYHGVEIGLWDKHDGIAQLSKIVVPKSNRNSGIGSAVMRELVAWADQNGRTMTLSPSVDFGGSSVRRLTRFYERFGFVQNKGRSKDYCIGDAMYRRPNDPA